MDLKIAAAPFLDDIALVASELVRRGWAEANAGNISVRLGAGPGVSELIVKKAGFRMRDLARDPLAGLCLLEFGPGDRSYVVTPEGAQPSSELPAHISSHDVLDRFRHHDRVVLHTHPTALISLANVYPDPKKLLSVLLRVHTEAPILLQEKTTAIKFLPPGSSALGRWTAQALERFSGVIWPYHGMLATGPDAVSCLDLIEVADKMAQVALGIGARLGTKTGLSPAQQKTIRRNFGLK
jgi:rhamnulose-1-phosphate aldolase